MTIHHSKIQNTSTITGTSKKSDGKGLNVTWTTWFEASVLSPSAAELESADEEKEITPGSQSTDRLCAGLKIKELHRVHAGQTHWLDRLPVVVCGGLRR